MADVAPVSHPWIEAPASATSPTKCDVIGCERQYSTPEQLDRHYRRAHGSRSTPAGSRMPPGSSAKVHREANITTQARFGRDMVDMQKFSQDKKGMWLCDAPGCPKKFIWKRDLARHRMVHGGPRHTCEGCQAKFTRVDALHRHVKDTCGRSKIPGRKKAKKAGEEAFKLAKVKAEKSSDENDSDTPDPTSRSGSSTTKDASFASVSDSSTEPKEESRTWDASKFQNMREAPFVTISQPTLLVV